MSLYGLLSCVEDVMSVYTSVVLSGVVGVWFVTQNAFLFQAEDGIRYLVRSRGLGDVYKRQEIALDRGEEHGAVAGILVELLAPAFALFLERGKACLLYTSDAADERSSVDLGGRRIIKQKNRLNVSQGWTIKLKHHSSRPHARQTTLSISQHRESP